VKLRRVLTVLAASVIPLTLAFTPAATAAQAAVRAAAARAAAGGPAPPSQCSAAYFDGDPRLGPLRLAKTGADGRELRGYRRTGGLPVAEFLATYWSPGANSGQGGWDYPPDNGYVIGAGGQPIESHLTVRPGSDMDRYGSEYGSFLSPAGLPYAQRSIPPQNLDSAPPASCNYHDYQVIKTFTVDAGPIAPWFGQPGYGLQYQLDATLIPGAPASINVMWLVNNGYLERLAS